MAYYPSKRKKTCEQGEYKSCLEYDFANYLLELGIEFEYEKDQYRYTLPERRYTVDWRVKTKTGKKLVIETKGRFDASDRSELVALKKCNPDLDIRLIFAKNDKIHKASSSRNMDWATKNGFKSAVKTIPEEWLNE